MEARTGLKIVAGFCTYVPEEIIYAGETITVRVLAWSRASP
jgi:benzoyl-CoA reductase/2-hydroxyglutaryl-CoA dehydratase subunit BcrC/BadD/HgdB